MLCDLKCVGLIIRSRWNSLNYCFLRIYLNIFQKSKKHLYMVEAHFKKHFQLHKYCFSQRWFMLSYIPFIINSYLAQLSQIVRIAYAILWKRYKGSPTETPFHCLLRANLWALVCFSLWTLIHVDRQQKWPNLLD